MVMSPEITTLSMGEVDRLDPEAVKSMAKAVLETEASAITNLISRLDSTFVKACEHMLACRNLSEKVPDCLQRYRSLSQ